MDHNILNAMPKLNEVCDKAEPWLCAIAATATAAVILAITLMVTQETSKKR